MSEEVALPRGSAGRSAGANSLPGSTGGASEVSVSPQNPRAGSARPETTHSFTPQAWAALVGLLILAGPTVYLIARASWTDEQSQQGPIVLAIGAWLLWRRWPAMRQVASKGSLVLVLAGYAACGVAYVAGRVASLYILEAYALYGFGLCSVYSLVGGRGLLKGLFPLLFLAFAAPVPFFVGWPVTVHLRLWISEATVGLLRLFGVSAARDGLTLFIESYRIEIAQACSGMNSLLALTALGLCYVHIRRDPPLRYYLVLFPVIASFAVVANFVRVILLSLLTLGFGDAVAQGVLHETLGFVTFGVALSFTFLADAGLARIWNLRTSTEQF